MKRILLLTGFIATVLLSNAQTVTADRVVARQGLYLKETWIDSLQKDTGFNGQTRAIPTSGAVSKYVTQKTIFNQFAVKQTASAWIDSVKLGKFYAADTGSKTPISINANDYQPLYVKDNFYGNIGLNNSFKNYGNAGPLIQFYTVSDSMKFRRDPVLRVDKEWKDSTPTVWGTNTYLLQSAATIANAFRPKVKGGSQSFVLKGGFDFAHTALISGLNFGWNPSGSGDTLKLTVNDGRLGAINHFMRNDFWSSGTPLYRHTGTFTSSAAVWDFQANGSWFGDIIDYYAGNKRGIGNGSNIKINNTYLFYGEDNGWNVINRPWGLYLLGTSNMRNYLQAPLYIGDTSYLNGDVSKLYVSGTTKLAGTLAVTSRATINGVADDGVTPLQVNGSIYGSDVIRSGFGGGKYGSLVADMGWNYSPSSVQDTTIGELVFSPAWYNSTYKYAGSAIRGYMMKNAQGINTNNGIKFYATGNDGYQGEHAVNREAMNLTPWGTLMVNLTLTSFDAATLQVKARWAGNPAQTWYNASSTKVATMSDAGKLTVQDLNLATTYTPTGTADATGTVGDVKRDDNYLYIKTSAGWKRAALSTF